MLSDKKKERPSPKARSIAKKGYAYSDSQKLEAVKLWLVTGNLVTTAAALNIPTVTVKSWRYSDWWDELVKDIKAENSIVLSNRLKHIVDKSHDLLMDRLEKGDYIYDQKKGELIRKPLVARDINIIAKDSLDRHLLLEKKPMQEEVNIKIQERLAQLGEAFEKLAKNKRPIEVIDVIYQPELLQEKSNGEANTEKPQ